MRKLFLLFVGLLLITTYACQEKLKEGSYGAYFDAPDVEFNEFSLDIYQEDRKTLYINGAKVSLDGDKVKGTIPIHPEASAVSVGPVDIEGTMGAYGFEHSKIEGTFSCMYTFSGQAARKINGTFIIW
jgi:hypothetical protein